MPVHDEEFASIPELVARVLAIAEGLAEGRPLWFRGLACADHSLTPKLFRGANDATAAFDRERRLAVRFRQRSLPFWPGGYPQSDWEHLFVMQHHGVPTRLLDWTENLFVGLYFALPAGPQHDPGNIAHDPCTPTLWCLDPVGWNDTVPQLQGLVDQSAVYTSADEEIVRPYTPANNQNRLLQRNDQPLAIYGTHNSERIVAQRGTFTIAGRSLDSLESFADGGPAELWKLRLTMSPTQLSKELSVLGFTESMIYPDLGALSRELTVTEI
jgi:hypothetical protein